MMSTPGYSVKVPFVSDFIMHRFCCPQHFLKQSDLQAWDRPGAGSVTILTMLMRVKMIMTFGV